MKDNFLNKNECPRNDHYQKFNSNEEYENNENSDYQQTNQQTMPINDFNKNKFKPAKKVDLIFFCLTILFSFILVSFGIAGGFKLGFTITVISFFVLSTAYLVKGAKKISAFALTCGILATVASGVYAIFVDEMICLLILGLILVLFSIYLNDLCQTNVYWQGGYKMVVDFCRTIFLAPFNNLGNVFPWLFQKNKDSSKKKKMVPVIIGLICALPVLLIVVPVLVQADAAFAAVINSFFSNFGEFIWYLICAVLITPLFFCMFFNLKQKTTSQSFIYKTKASKPLSMAANEETKTYFNNTGTCVFLGVICAFYVIYLLSQLTYFFSGFAGIVPQNYAPAEDIYFVADYAKRGFFEMCFISIINLGLIIVTTLLNKRENGKISLSLKILNTFLSGFTLILISTAISKMFMYINKYGLTRLRLLTSIFMFSLAFIFIFLTIRLYISKFPYMKFIIIMCSLILIGTGYMDIDSTIAKTNISEYESGNLKELDLNLISTLSPSVIPQVVKLTKSENDVARNDAKRIIESYYFDNVKDIKNKDQSLFNKIRKYNFTKNQIMNLYN